MQGTLIGKVVGEVRSGSAGDTPVVNFRVRSSRYVGKGKGYEGSGYDSVFWSVAFFGSRASAVAPLLAAGKAVAIVGEAYLREYTHNGEKRSELEVKASDVTLLDRLVAAPSHAPSPYGGGSRRAPSPEYDAGDPDIPF